MAKLLVHSVNNTGWREGTEYIYFQYVYLPILAYPNIKLAEIPTGDCNMRLDGNSLQLLDQLRVLVLGQVSHGCATCTKMFISNYLLLNLIEDYKYFLQTFLFRQLD